MPFYEMLPGGMPAGLQSDMDAVLNKKWGTSTTYPPEDWPETVNLMGPLPERTVSGSVVAFSDGADDVPIKSASFGILASGGGGTPSTPVPIVGASSVKIFQTGVNLIDTDASAWENNGIDYQTGQNATSATKKRTIGYYPIKGYQNIVVSGVSISSGSSSLRFFWYDKDFNYLGYRNMPPVPYAVGYQATCYFRLAIDRDIDISALQIEYAETTASTYEAYKAKTPITVQLGQTVYGGTLAEDGTLTIDFAYAEFKDLTWQKHSTAQNTYFADVPTAKTGSASSNVNAICSAYTVVTRNNQTGQTINYSISASNVNGGRFFVLDDSYSSLEDFQEATKNYQLAYELATPIVITGLDEISISTYLGDNTIWADTGDTSVTYRRDIDLALAQ